MTFNMLSTIAFFNLMKVIVLKRHCNIEYNLLMKTIVIQMIRSQTKQNQQL